MTDNIFPESKFQKADDYLYQLSQGDITLNGYFDDKIRLVMTNILKALDYRKMVDYFRYQSGIFAAGEFWGKIMRAACLSYKYTQDAELKKIIDDSVKDLLSVQTENGCISNFKIEFQPYHSDLWERKYLLLGLQGYYEITGDAGVLEAMIKLADYTISQVGPAPKTEITDTGWAFEGIESSSILEPIVKLYNITGYQRYLEFAKYIVEDTGACKRCNIFEEIYNGKDPKDIGNNGDPKKSIAKAYEMMSCFEGLIEYYRVTGNEHWKKAAIRFYEKVRDQEITIIGSGGADKPYNLGPGTGEQWNYAAYEQTNPDITLMQETCVTVTWMKLCYQIFRLTGDSKVGDQIEKSIYNALSGALNPKGNYFEYFPKLKGIRDSKINFGYNVGDFPLSCCTANGPMGMALIPFAAVMNSCGGPVINLYIPGKADIVLSDGSRAEIQIVTDYPKTDAVVIRIIPGETKKFSVKLRIPEWSKKTLLKVNNEKVPVTNGTFAEINRVWNPDDKIELILDMRCRLICAPHGINRAGDNFIALIRGPLTLCYDRRLAGDINNAKNIIKDAGGYSDTAAVIGSKVANVECKIKTSTGDIHLMDYASAGATWDETSGFCTWLPC